MSGKNSFNLSKLMIFCLLLSGIQIDGARRHPVIETIINSILYYLNVIILQTVVFAETYWLVDGILIGRDFVELSLAAPCITISILGTLKIIPLYFKRHIVVQIIDTLKEIHPIEDNFDDNEEDTEQIKNKKIVDFFNTGQLEEFRKINYHTGLSIIKEKIYDDAGSIEKDTEKRMNNKELIAESKKLLKTVEYGLFAICVLVLAMFVLAPSVSMYLEYSKTGELRIKYPFPVKYWFNVYEIWCWPLVYLHQVWASVIVAVNLFATETFFYSVCTYVEMHFRILCLRFESIQATRKTQEELVVEIKKHQLLMSLVDQMESLYSLPSCYHIISSSLLICLSAFNITATQEIETMFAFLTFLMMSLSQIFLLCFFGDKLMRSSTEVSGAVYKCPWYDFDVRTRKVAFIAVIRSQKPCKLTAANFADLNLRAFTTILSRSWSYFALLKTVYN